MYVYNINNQGKGGHETERIAKVHGKKWENRGGKNADLVLVYRILKKNKY